MSTLASIPIQSISTAAQPARFPLDRWYVAGFSSEFTSKPIGRTFLNQKVVLFRTGDRPGRGAGRPLLPPVAAAVLRHRGGERRALRLPRPAVCAGRAVHRDPWAGEPIPVQGQGQVLPRRQKNKILWIWMPHAEGAEPPERAARIPLPRRPGYKFGSDMYHYNAPWQLIHDNLLDLSHLGYVHLHTIGGNARLHMNATMKVTQEGDTVKVVRRCRAPRRRPPTWPPGPSATSATAGRRSNSTCRTCGSGPARSSPGTDAIDDPDRGGFHMRGFHGITPETEETLPLLLEHGQHQASRICRREHRDGDPADRLHLRRRPRGDRSAIPEHARIRRAGRVDGHPCGCRRQPGAAHRGSAGGATRGLSQYQGPQDCQGDE